MVHDPGSLSGLVDAAGRGCLLSAIHLKTRTAANLEPGYQDLGDPGLNEISRGVDETIFTSSCCLRWLRASFFLFAFLTFNIPYCCSPLPSRLSTQCRLRTAEDTH